LAHEISGLTRDNWKVNIIHARKLIKLKGKENLFKLFKERKQRRNYIYLKKRNSESTQAEITKRKNNKKKNSKIISILKQISLSMPLFLSLSTPLAFIVGAKFVIALTSDGQLRR